MVKNSLKFPFLITYIYQEHQKHIFFYIFFYVMADLGFQNNSSWIFAFEVDGWSVILISEYLTKQKLRRKVKAHSRPSQVNKMDNFSKWDDV